MRRVKMKKEVKNFSRRMQELNPYLSYAVQTFSDDDSITFMVRIVVHTLQNPCG